MAVNNIKAYKAVGGGIFEASPPHFTSYIINGSPLRFVREGAVPLC